MLSPRDSFEPGMEDEMLNGMDGNRPRSRTWPLPQPEDFESQKSPEVEEKVSTAKLEPGSKKGSRKNAWGNQSYADLITQAIQSAPEQRMTLSQIYGWMVQNVEYFKDKGDNTSSAGWKNSIRHNLSLHNRFIRIQNEGNGKSSWWMVDADAKTEKTKRRSRSSSLDSDNGPKTTKTKRPGRKSKRSEHNEDKPLSPNSKLRVTPKSPINVEPSVILEDNPFPFPLADYRHRSSSNASNVSSISGRLSPIPSHDEELDYDENMSTSPTQEQHTPVVVEELMDNIKENLNVKMPHPQPAAQADIAAFRARCNEDSMNIDSPPASQFVDNRYQSAEYFPAPSIKQAPFAASKIPPQKSLYKEAPPNTLQQHLNGVYLRGNMNSPSNFQRNISQIIHPDQRPPPPPYNVHVNNSIPRTQSNPTRLAMQGNNYTPYYHTPQTEAVPMISVEMADSVALPVDFDIDFLERLDRDITCDVETVLRNDSAFNDGHLDFNLDNYVSSIALPEISISSHISGSMVH